MHGGATGRRRRPRGARRARSDRREIHRRIASAIGPGAQPGTIAALEMAFFGALVHAGSGKFTYHEVADRLADVAVLILVGAGQAAPGDDLAEPAAEAGEDA